MCGRTTFVFRCRRFQLLWAPHRSALTMAVVLARNCLRLWRRHAILSEKALRQEEEVEDWRTRIVLDPQILVGKPTVRGTRLAVELIIDLLAQGWTEAEILNNYPGLTREDVQACLSYASATLRAEKVYPIAAA